MLLYNSGVYSGFTFCCVAVRRQRSRGREDGTEFAEFYSFATVEHCTQLVLQTECLLAN